VFEGLDPEPGTPLPPAGSPPGAVARAVLKGPVHTCRIKDLHGLREWVNTQVRDDAGPYAGIVTVLPYSQPPNLNLLDASDRLLHRVKVLPDATAADITGWLQAHGVWGRGQGPDDDAGVDGGEADGGAEVGVEVGVGVEVEVGAVPEPGAAAFAVDAGSGAAAAAAAAAAS
jgi:hypothetical protein